METKHTPEPWEEYAGNIRTVEANEKYGDGYRAEFRRRPIADVVNIRGQEEVNKANAQRIVSCVNACKGINPEVVPELLAFAQMIVNGGLNEAGEATIESEAYELIAKATTPNP